MKRLENLPEITNDMLGGLHADDKLKEDILRSAKMIENGEKVKRNTPWELKPARPSKARTLVKRTAALACTAAFVIGLLVGIPSMIATPVNESPITTQQGGENLPAGDARALDVPRGSISISKSDKPAYRGVWEAANGANFPLVCVEGRYYRLMSNPTEIGGDLLGAAIGTVAEKTSEPALMSGGVFSNVVEKGETVYAVNGMNGALAAAKVNGKMRVFQRVSFGSVALKGGESLGDTLRAGNVVALELTGVGTVTDAAKAQELYKTLVNHASLKRAGASETNQSLLIQLKNGIVLQLSVRDESVMACGTWDCPEFFEAFASAVK